MREAWPEGEEQSRRISRDRLEKERRQAAQEYREVRKDPS